MKVVEHPNHDFVIQDYSKLSKPASMVVGWCRTTKFDWFAFEHEGGGLTEQSKIVHFEFGDLADPRFEPLDVAVLHIIHPTLHNLGSLTPKIEPRIAFALFRHNFDDPKHTMMLMMHHTLSRSNMRFAIHHMSIKDTCEHIASICNGGFSLTLASDVFDSDDLKKISSSFKSRMRRAMKTAV